MHFDLKRIFRVVRFRRDVSRDVREEIAFHLERTREDLEARGWAPEDAAREALRRFGDTRSHRENIERLERGRWRVGSVMESLDVLGQHLRFALRSARRSPGFALAVVVTLGLGLGANAVMFGVVDRLLLTPPQHIVEPDQVRHLYLERTNRGDPVPRASRWLTYPDYLDLREVGAFRSVAAYTVPLDVTVGRGADAERVRLARTSPSLFALLGVRPATGRFFSPDDDREGAPLVAVLSYEYWERRFGANHGTLGTTLEIGDGRYEVVGVAPPGFTGAELSPVDVWLPLAQFARVLGNERCLESRGCWWLWTVGRLSSEGSVEAAEAQATALVRAGHAESIEAGSFDAAARIVTSGVIAARGPDPSTEAAVSTWLLGVSAIVLLIACANVANLLLARAVRWRRELAVRVALGVSRGRLLSQLLVEALFLSGLGAGAAVLVARVGGPLMHRSLLPNVAFTDAGTSSRLLAFVAAAALLASVLSGLVPALQATRADVAVALKGSGGGTRARSRVGVGLLTAQAMLSVLLLVGAGLFVRSLAEVDRLDLGFDPERVVAAELQWVGEVPAAERSAIYERALERVRGLSGVESAALTYTLPFWSSISVGVPRVPGLDSFPRHPAGGPYVNFVGSGYFEAMGLSVFGGRPFEPADDSPTAEPVAVVSASMADDVWPRQSAIGRCFFLGEDDSPCTRVVGVVEDHRRNELVEDDPHHFYFLNLNHPDFSAPPQALVARTTEPDALAAEAARVLLDVAPQIRFVNARPLSDHVAPKLRSWKLGAIMFSIFGLLALVVAAVGLYSVLAFEVAQRRHELGIRSALGATRRALVRLVFRRATRFTTIGLSLGLGVALATSRFVEPLLFRVSARDPTVYAGVGLVLAAVAAVAATLPAWRATRVRPATALREE